MRLFSILSAVRVWSAGIATLALTGCPSLPRFEPPGEQPSSAAAAQLCESTRAALAPPSSLRALLETTVTARGESASFRYVVVEQAPDKLRVDILPDIGAYTVGQLVSRSGITTIVDSQQKTYVRGADEAALVEQFLGLKGFDRSLLVSAVAGSLPAFSCERSGVFEHEGRLILVDRERHRAFEIRGSRLEAIESLDASESYVRFRIHRDVSAGDQMQSVTVQLYDPIEAEAAISIQRLMLNPVINDTLFMTDIPADYTEAD